MQNEYLYFVITVISDFLYDKNGTLISISTTLSRNSENRQFSVKTLRQYYVISHCKVQKALMAADSVNVSGHLAIMLLSRFSFLEVSR